MTTDMKKTTTDVAPTPERSLKAPFTFGAFVILAILTMAIFFTTLNTKEKMIRDIIANHDLKIQGLQQQKTQLETATNNLNNVLTQENDRYVALNAELARLQSIPRNIPVKSTPAPLPTPTPTPVVKPPVVVTPKPAPVVVKPTPKPTPVVVTPPRNTRAS